MPGAIEYQGLHSDNTWTELERSRGGASPQRAAGPAVTINFAMVDLTPENGPIRRSPEPRTAQPIPNLVDEPEWMKLSTVCPAARRLGDLPRSAEWHGGTPNLSREVRATPNIEYFALWFRSEAVIRSMPYEQWKTFRRTASASA